MFAEKAFRLVKELKRDTLGVIQPYNEDSVRQVLEEMKVLYEANHKEVTATLAGDQEGGVQEYFSGIQMRHAGLERNKRCLLVYLHSRIEHIRELRWEFGSVLPADIKYNLSEQEVVWFNKYNKTLATYMRSIGNKCGLDLTQDMTPPKTLYIEVRCLADHGEFETQDGKVILLKKNTQHFLLRSECEYLIRQGILEHIVS